MQHQTPSVLIITGTVGVGKSTVADEIYETLKMKHEPVALINLDEFGYAAPHPENDRFNRGLQLKNLAVTWPNYAELGIRSLIIPCVIETQDDLEAFHQALPDAQVFVVQLNATLATIESRIKSRLMGGSLEWHLQRARELQEITTRNHLAHAVIDSNHVSIKQAAQQIIEQWER